MHIVCGGGDIMRSLNDLLNKRVTVNLRDETHYSDSTLLGYDNNGVTVDTASTTLIFVPYSFIASIDYDD
jgi:hypothetical protein